MKGASVPLSPSRLDSSIYLGKKLPAILSKTKNLIDVGCGKLYFYYMLNELGYSGNYTGVDIDTKKQINSKGFSVIRKNILSVNTAKKFDLAVSLWMLEHVKEDQKVLIKINQLLKNNGTLILAVPSIWSWPFEFGKHGYHYYTNQKIKKMVVSSGFRVSKVYESGGLLGIAFMLLYNWPRFALLLIGLGVWLVVNKLTSKKVTWAIFSKKLISNSLYSYHRTKLGIQIHNYIVGYIVKLDNSFKVLPSSYILIAQKK